MDLSGSHRPPLQSESLESELFVQVTAGPPPRWKRRYFRLVNFRLVVSKAPHATTITSVDLGNALQGVRALSGAQLALAFLGATTPIVVSAKDVGMRDLWLARLSRVIATYRGPNPPTAAPGSSRSFSIARTIRITDFVSVDAADDEEDSEVSEDDEPAIAAATPSAPVEAPAATRGTVGRERGNTIRQFFTRLGSGGGAVDGAPGAAAPATAATQEAAAAAAGPPAPPLTSFPTDELDDERPEPTIVINPRSPRDNQRFSVKVEIHQARNLPAMDLNNTSDPYCVLSIGAEIRTSKTIQRNLFPIWNETLTFQDVSFSEFYYLRVDVMDHDVATADDFIGGALIPLACLSTTPFTGWFPLGALAGFDVVRKETVPDILLTVSISDNPDRRVEEMATFYEKVAGMGYLTTMPDGSTLELPGEAEQVEIYIESARLHSQGHHAVGSVIVTNYRLIFFDAAHHGSTPLSPRTSSGMVALATSATTLPPLAVAPERIAGGPSVFVRLGNEMDSTFFLPFSMIGQCEAQRPPLCSIEIITIDAAQYRIDFPRTMRAVPKAIVDRIASVLNNLPWISPAIGLGRYHERRIHGPYRHQFSNVLRETRPEPTSVNVTTSTAATSLSGVGAAARNSPYLAQLPDGSRPDNASAHSGELLPTRVAAEGPAKANGTTGAPNGTKGANGTTVASLDEEAQRDWSDLERQNAISVDAFDMLAEYKRQCVSLARWRMSFINVNYAVCPTYPAVLGFPNRCTDEIARQSARFRSKGRLPVLSWYNQRNNCVIVRCAQPNVGLTNSRSTHDQELIAFVRLTSGKPSLLIFDARSLASAQTNRFKGHGTETEHYTECRIIYLDIPNIHVMRSSVDKLTTLAREPRDRREATWASTLRESNWMEYVRKLLASAVDIVYAVEEKGYSVVVHCSDGWDRTAQLTSLSELLLDPYYRSYSGFLTLIHKEWVAFGHKFSDRNAKAGVERSPIFLQFLDCVHQLLLQFPEAFEFNERALIALVDVMHAGFFGTFAFNCESGRIKGPPTFSVFAHFESMRPSFTNRNYNARQHEVLVPIASHSVLQFWANYFMRYSSIHHRHAPRHASVAPPRDDRALQAGSERGFWARDEDVAACERCSAVFSMFRRRHHCRLCGHIYCSNCVRRQMIPPSMTKPDLVCMRCETTAGSNATD